MIARSMRGLVAMAAVLFVTGAGAQEVKHYRFAYDQPRNTGYSIAGDLFADKLKELSKGTMIIDQYPGAQLGQEPQVLQLVKAGDIEFAIISSANTATISPQAGVMSLHFLFRDENHVIKGLADPRVFEALKTMIDETTQGLHVIATGLAGRAPHVLQEGDPQCRRHQGPEGPRAGDRDRGHHVPGLQRPDRAHAVRQRLHLACKPAWSTSPRTASTSISSTSTTRSRRSSTSPSTRPTTHWYSSPTSSGRASQPSRSGWVQTAANEISTKEPPKAFDLERTAAEEVEEDGRQDRRGRRQEELYGCRRSLSRQARARSSARMPRRSRIRSGRLISSTGRNWMTNG